MTVEELYAATVEVCKTVKHDGWVTCSISIRRGDQYSVYCGICGESGEKAPYVSGDSPEEAIERLRGEVAKHTGIHYEGQDADQLAAAEAL